MQDIKQLTLNPLLYLNNVILYNKNTSLVYDKSTISRDRIFFSKFYFNESFPLSFWQNQFTNKANFQIHPASTFYEKPFVNDSNTVGLFFPLIVKNNWYNEFYMAAFLDVNKLFQAHHLSINNNFFILDDQGNRLFSSSSDSGIGNLPRLVESQNYLKMDKYYYFYKKGPVSGLTYVNVVPDEYVSSQVSINVSLVSLFVLSVVISIITSFLLSKSFHIPVRNILDSIQQLKGFVPVQSRINEFNLIGRQISQILEINQDIHEDLSHKNSLLKTYTYISSLKKIRSNVQLNFINKPFVFILFELTFKDRHNEPIDSVQNWAYSIKEFIDLQFTEHSSETLTFQIEEKQILTFFFTDEAEKMPVKIILDRMEQVFSNHREGFVTVAVSSIYVHSSELTKAYEEALNLIKLRRLGDDTQIIDSSQAFSFQTNDNNQLMLSPQQEHEFYVNLQAGNVTEALKIVQRALAQLLKREAVLVQYHNFAKEIINKTANAMTVLQVDSQKINIPVPVHEQILSCFTFQQISEFLEGFLTSSASMIREKKEERDYITHFVVEFLKENYAQDISLELMAEKLNITGGYLSTYFKDKTGTNFIDYLNEVRITKAQEMLRHSNRKIQEVAKRSGYQNMNSFNRMFKKFSGITPSEFRKLRI
jgi:YesN/AraC family two-component response regulator